MTVAQADGVDSKPALEKPAVKEEVKAEVEEAPVKRTAKKEEAPAPKKDINKILEEWDEEE